MRGLVSRCPGRFSAMDACAENTDLVRPSGHAWAAALVLHEKRPVFGDVSGGQCRPRRLAPLIISQAHVRRRSTLRASHRR